MAQNLRIGLDTGGTYTDLAVISQQRELLYSDKTLTTHADLLQAIRTLLQRLPKSLSVQCKTLALSTTLATNAVVEQRDSQVVLLACGYRKAQLDLFGLNRLLLPHQIHLVSGAMDALGNEAHPLDTERVTELICEQVKQADAIAVSGLFATRNATHELKIREMIRNHSDLPVVLGSELSAELGAAERAVTATVNARMLGLFHHFLASVRAVVESLALDVDIHILKGDGVLTPMNVVRDYPVSTVLSGPAASILSAKQVSEKQTRVTVDIGGTTSDIGLIKEGQAWVTDKGAKVGGWPLKVRAVRMRAVGLGFDSEVGFNGVDGVFLEARRVLPLSLATMQYPDIRQALAQRLKQAPSAIDLRFAVPHSPTALEASYLSALERTLLQQATKEPLDLLQLNAHNRGHAKAVARLVRNGHLIYTGMTLADAAHALGYCDHWDSQSARLTAQLWERLVFGVYGCRQWQKGDVQAACELVFSLLLKQLHAAIEELLMWHEGDFSDAEVRQLIYWTKRMKKVRDRQVTLMFHPELKLVLTGKPAALLKPYLQKQLGIEVLTPHFSEVANAFGAACGSAQIDQSVEITSQKTGLYRVHLTSDIQDFSDLDQAITHASKQVRAQALKMAHVYQFSNPIVEDTVEDQSAYSDSGECVFFQARVHAHVRPGP